MARRRAELVAVLSAAAILLSTSAASAQQESRLATPGNLLAALHNISAEVQALNHLDAQSMRVVIVDAGELLSGNNGQVLSTALNANQANILALQHFLNNDRTAVGVAIREGLARNQLVVGEVVAIDVLNNGDVIVFYQLLEPGRAHKV